MITRFSELVGNTTKIQLIKRSLMMNAFRHTTILCGPKGTGKSSCAHIAAMALTCSSPVDGEPCLQCKECKANLVALGSTGKSPYIQIVNFGKFSRTEDVSALIKDVFGLQNSSRNQVYIFEEAHALKGIKNGYTALLTEIDQMSPNTYLIFCTTSVHDLQGDLRSRALEFEFFRLNKKESDILIARVSQRRGARIHSETAHLIAEYAKGIPRDIEKLVDFVVDTSVTLEEMRDFLQAVPHSVFVEIFSAMKVGDLTSVLELISSLEDRSSVRQIIESFKDFVVNTIFYLEIQNSDVFSGSEKRTLKDTFSDNGVIFRVADVLDKLQSNAGRAEFMLAVMKIYSIMQGSSPKSVIANNTSNAAKNRIISEDVLRGKEVSGTGGMSGLNSLTLQSLDKFR